MLRLVPTYRFDMDLISFNRYKSNGLSKNDEYIVKLSSLKLDEDYYEFFDVIDAIIAEKTTVEQESFLEILQIL